MELLYASEKLASAVSYAIGSTESLQERLKGCYAYFHTLDHPGHLPSDLQARFDAMIQAFTRESDPTGKRGLVAATVDKMDDEEARRWLEEILSLYTEVETRIAGNMVPAS